MGNKGKSTVVKSASVPVELANLMEANNISPSEAMRVGILTILENREYIFVNEKLSELLAEKKMVKVENAKDTYDMIEEVPIHQLPKEMKAKRIAMNLYKQAKDTMTINKRKVIDFAIANGVSIGSLMKELKSYGIDIL